MVDGLRPSLSLSLSLPMPAKASLGLNNFEVSDFDLSGGESGEVSLSGISFERGAALLLGEADSDGDGDRGISDTQNSNRHRVQAFRSSAYGQLSKNCNVLKLRLADSFRALTTSVVQQRLVP